MIWPADVTVPPPPMRGRLVTVPWPERPRFIRWEAAPDPRTRAFHMLAPPISDEFWDDAGPPDGLGMFNCRGEYVVRRPVPKPAPLPEGLFEIDGRVMFSCLACGNATELPVDLDEFDPASAYCGGSPRCLP